MSSMNGSRKTQNENKFNSQYYVHNLCRSCLCEVHKDYFWLESYYRDKKLTDIYENVTSIQIGSNESFPKKLCISCYDHVIKFDLFKNKALESDKILLDNCLLISSKITESKAEKNTENIENIGKIENDLENNSDADDPFFEDTESEDEMPISKRLEKNFEQVKKCEVETENTEVNHSKELKDIDVIDHKISEDLQVRPKVKFKKHVLKRRFKGQVDTRSVKDKQKRERKKEPCRECGKVIVSYKMENHMRTHTKEKPYGCEKCGIRFSEKSNLNRHMKIHGSDRPYKCGFCGKGFLRPSSKVMHEMTAHNSEKKVLCPICTKGFKHQYFLNKHMKTIHDKPDIRIEIGSGYTCPICGNVYRTKSSLGVHKMKHEHPKAFLCNICGNAYSTKAVLENHQKIHTGEKNFSCNTCNKKFRFISTLKTHVLVHSGEKPLSCIICNKQFRQHSHLNTHMRGQHSSNRPYQCSFCSKTFKYSSNLTVHTRIHTGETPYLCDVCHKGFYDSSSMKKHKKSHFVKNTLPVAWVKVDVDLDSIEKNILQT